MSDADIEVIKASLLSSPGVKGVQVQVVCQITTVMSRTFIDESENQRMAVYDIERQLLERFSDANLDFNVVEERAG